MWAPLPGGLFAIQLVVRTALEESALRAQLFPVAEGMGRDPSAPPELASMVRGILS